MWAFFFFFFFFFMTILTGCHTGPSARQEITDRTLASMKHQLDSIERRQRNLETHIEKMHGRKINHETGTASASQPIPIIVPQKTPVKTPDVSLQRAPMVETNRFPKKGKTHKEENKFLGPKELISSAESKIVEKEYGEALLYIHDINKYFPNFDDKGRRYLIEAVAYINLQDYKKALLPLRKFYQKYPNGIFLQRAKFYEAQAYEGLEDEKHAYEIYSEIVGMDPYTVYGESSKNAMKRIKNE